MSNNSVPQPKMINSKKYQQRYEEINWDENLIICSECGRPCKKIDKDKYMIYDGDDWKCKVCNFN